MKKYLAIVMFGTYAVSAALAQATPAPAPPPKVAYFIEPDRVSLSGIIPPPPAADSEHVKKEFADLHKIQDTRTPEQVLAAQKDDAEEDIFIYKNVLGPDFNANALPVTALLSAHVHNDEPVAGNVLKQLYKRPRPYQADPSLHPVCKTTTAPDSYPSGHTISGYLLAFTLIQIVPEKRDAILARATDYAHNRLVCGVHTKSDTDASRLVAYSVFGAMMQSGRFQQELSAARQETRASMHMNP